MPKLKFKKLDEKAVIPSKAHPSDAGYDLAGFDLVYNTEKDYVQYRTHLAVEIPEGYSGFIFPRSSVTKTNLLLGNSVGVIDSSYRGEILIRFKFHNGTKLFENGSNVAQLVILETPDFEVEEVQELTETVRGEGGFGSTSKNRIVLYEETKE